MFITNRTGIDHSKYNQSCQWPCLYPFCKNTVLKLNPERLCKRFRFHRRLLTSLYEALQGCNPAYNASLPAKAVSQGPREFEIKVNSGIIPIKTKKAKDPGTFTLAFIFVVPPGIPACLLRQSVRQACLPASAVSQAGNRGELYLDLSRIAFNFLFPAAVLKYFSLFLASSDSPMYSL